MVGSPCSPRDSQEYSPTPPFKSIDSLALSFLYSPTLTSIMTAGKNIALTRQTFVGKIMSLLFNMLSRLVIGYNQSNFNIDHLVMYTCRVVSCVVRRGCFL